MGEFVQIDNSQKEKQRQGIPYKKMKEAYLQWVPGVVLDVTMNSDSPSYIGGGSVNSIIAKKHFGSSISYKSMISTRYYPLLRGVHDVPIKGDQVLLFEGDAGQNYYLGPINTINSVNLNPDPLNVVVNQYHGNTQMVNQIDGEEEKISYRDKYNIPPNYPITSMCRLQTKTNSKLDDPKNDRIGEDGSIAKTETFGDMILEGRFGNSIRLGYRHKNPLLFLSNGRNVSIPFESLYDGSIFTMTSKGSLVDHFDDIILGSDMDKDNPRLIAGGNDSDETNRFNYNWGNDGGDTPIFANQIFMGSEKITINARKDNITISARQNIDIGAANNLTINTRNYTCIESSNVFLGKQAIDKNEPLVLGTQLQDFLKRFLKVMSTATAMVQGAPVPLTDARGVAGKPLSKYLNDLLTELENSKFLSEYHFIENNGQKAD